MKIHPVGTEFFDADRRTDMAKLIVDLRKKKHIEMPFMKMIYIL
jgi:hypothetical protein